MTAWMSPMQTAAQTQWTTHGWPSQRLEAWRNTNLRKAEKVATGVPSSGDWTCDLGDIAGVTAVALKHASESPLVREWLGKVAPAAGAENALCGRNTALFDDGIAIVVDASTTVSEPISVSFGDVSAATPDLVQRGLIVAGPNSDVTVIFRFDTDSTVPFVRNVVAEVVALPGARVRCIWLQEEDRASFHLATFAAQIHRDASVQCHVMQFGAALSRFDARVRLAGTGASCKLNGLYVGDEKQHHDCHIDAHHDAGHTTSEMLFKGILDDRASGVFRGNVLIHEGASKSASEQLNRNLLLSDNAVANTKPQLEIDNDDVRAAHGATVGELDADALFYLKTRGISGDSARRMLIAGYAAEVIDQIPDAAIRDIYSARFAV